MDSEEMYEIVTNQFSKISQEYLVSEKETTNITTALQKKLSTIKLKDMYESDDRDKCVMDMIIKIFKGEIKKEKE